MANAARIASAAKPSASAAQAARRRLGVGRALEAGRRGLAGRWSPIGSMSRAVNVSTCGGKQVDGPGEGQGHAPSTWDGPLVPRHNEDDWSLIATEPTR